MNPFFVEIARGACPTMDECVEALGDALPLLRDFANTPQDRDWHAEGDVHIHTSMVLAEAYSLLAGPASHLTGTRRLLFVLGALLHDIGKPVCTREAEVRGVWRTVAQAHEAEGRSYLAPRLIRHGLAYEDLETLLGVVGYHHEPKRLASKERPLGAYKRVCRLADPELLYWVEQADMRGRTCADRREQIDNIDVFRLFAEEYGAFSRGGDHLGAWSEQFAISMSGYSDDARDLALAQAQRSLEAGDILSVEEAIARSFAQRDAFSDLVVMVGPSGAGKSSFVAKHLMGFDVVSLDAIRDELCGRRADQQSNGRVLAAARERLKVSLRAKRRVVWDATSLRTDFRTRTAGLGFDYGALVTFVVFHFDAPTYGARNAGRPHAVEPSVLQGQIDSMQWPELDEAHRVIYLDDKHRVLGAFGVGGALPYGLSPAP